MVLRNNLSTQRLCSVFFNNIVSGSNSNPQIVYIAIALTIKQNPDTFL